MKLGLRTRGAIAFAILGLLVSIAMAVLTYQVARAYLLDQRDALVVRQAGLNARALNAGLGTPETDFATMLASLPSTSGSHALAVIDGEWFSSALPIDNKSVPDDFVAATSDGRPVKQRLIIDGTPTMIVGVPLTRATGTYFEIAPLNELQRTLSVLQWSLTAAAAITAVIGALVGLYASRRVLKPLRDFSQAAEAIGRGRFETRLSLGADPDLAVLGAAFNDMAEALEHRTERDARFASDVSHELRNPLAALTAAVDVLEVRADERTRPAIDVVRAQVGRFRGLVLDLLELSRLDSGSPELVLADVAPRSYFAATVERIAGPTVELIVRAEVPARVRLDTRRVEQVLANLLDNAQQYGGGATRVEIGIERELILVAVEDAGPGVPDHERESVFDRFHRGAGKGSAANGSGLGLAIVAEHCRAHGGVARVEGRAGGGARFVAAFRNGEQQ